ncbi:MAG: BTAD domain-containing putative transcriptional regulator, partial [Acidimicrobiia bacterium]
APTCEQAVAYLAISGRSLARRTLIGHIWPDSDPVRCLARLRNVIWKINVIVPDLVVGGELDTRLHEEVRVDLDDARDLANRLMSSTGRVASVDTFDVLQHQLLADWDEEWLDVERRDFNILRLRALEQVARDRLEAACFFEAERACRTVIGAEPYRESARLLLAEICIAEGNVGVAFSELSEFARVLHDELGIAPNHEIQELVASIQAQV